MKFPTLEAHCAEDIFQIQSPICGVYFSNNMWISQARDKKKGNWTWLELWKLSTINLEDKSFHNSKEWLGFNLKCVSHHSWGKFSDLLCSNYWKMHFETFSHSLHDLIIRPHVKQPPLNLTKKFCSPMKSFFKEKSLPHFFGERSLSHKNYTMPCIRIFSHF